MSITKGFEHFIREDEPLAPHTWLRLGGPAQYFAEPTTVEELAELASRCREAGVPIRLLGGGSNLLVRDEGVPGVVVQLTGAAFSEIRSEGNTLIVGGGAKLAHVISIAVRDGLAGLEQLVGIPGTIGGALRTNAGAPGGDIGQFTSAATVMTRDGKIIERQRSELHFAYRQSSLDELVIVGAKLSLEQEEPREVARRMQTLWIVKKANQPLGDPNAGCVFKNPRGGDAADVIEQAGMKGARVGGAEVSSQHANFIVVDRGGTSSDVLKLIDEVKEQTANRLGVELELQIEIW